MKVSWNHIQYRVSTVGCGDYTGERDSPSRLTKSRELLSRAAGREP